LHYTPIIADVNLYGKGYLTASEFIKEPEKNYISCKKILLFLFIVYSILPAEGGFKETYAYGPFCGFGSIPLPPIRKHFLPASQGGERIREKYDKWIQSCCVSLQVEGEAGANSDERFITWFPFSLQLHKDSFFEPFKSSLQR
jgi:hypothetical protein